jgi:hypothetical protein
MQDLKKRYLGVVYEGVKDYNGLFGRTCNTVATIATLLIAFGIITVVRHLTKMENELKKIRDELKKQG